MTRDELLRQLRDLRKSTDPEAAHVKAEELLLKFIGDRAVTTAFRGVPRWYA